MALDIEVGLGRFSNKPLTLSHSSNQNTSSPKRSAMLFMNININFEPSGLQDRNKFFSILPRAEILSLSNFQ